MGSGAGVRGCLPVGSQRVHLHPLHVQVSRSSKLACCCMGSCMGGSALHAAACMSHAVGVCWDSPSPHPPTTLPPPPPTPTAKPQQPARHRLRPGDHRRRTLRVLRRVLAPAPLARRAAAAVRLLLALVRRPDHHCPRIRRIRVQQRWARHPGALLPEDPAHPARAAAVQHDGGDGKAGERDIARGDQPGPDDDFDDDHLRG